MDYREQKERLEKDLKYINMSLKGTIPVFCVCMLILLFSRTQLSLVGIRALAFVCGSCSVVFILQKIVRQHRYKKLCAEIEAMEKAEESKPKVKAPIKRPKAVPPVKAKAEEPVKEEVVTSAPEPEKKVEAPKADPVPEKKVEAPKDEYIDDPSFVKDMRMVINGPWAKFDILIDARPYGWAGMLDWADYLVKNDFLSVDQVQSGSLMSHRDLTSEFKTYKNIKDMPSLKNEMGTLSVAGYSMVLGDYPMKVVWINQTNTLTLFTPTNNEDLIRRYAETIIRRTLGTPDEMKLGKPHK